MSGNKFRQVTNELYEILKDEVPEISNWKQEVLGPAYPKELTGFICCDTVEYAPFSTFPAAIWSARSSRK